MKKINFLKLVIIAVIIPVGVTHFFLRLFLQGEFIEIHKGTTEGALITVAGYVVITTILTAIVWVVLMLLKYFKKI